MRLVPSVGVALMFGSGVSLLSQQPQFRATVTLVPVEVRVVDKNASAVTDLQREDFRVTENGVAQEIAQFQALSVSDTSGAIGRSFMIVLGRGQLNAPTNSIQGLINFVRTRCGPADRVGVTAYLRTIPLTTNHEMVARFLEAYRDRHYKIEEMLFGVFPFPMSPATRAAIDSLFERVDVTVQELAGSSGTSISKFNNFRYLKNALEYLGTVDGEKHAIVVTEQPFATPFASDSPSRNYWVLQATAARTALFFIHAGGLNGPSMYRGKLSASRGSMPSPLGIDPAVIQMQEQTADLTGGTSAFYVFGDQALNALDHATRSYYLLGYYPKLIDPAPAFRRIQVSVKRPGVTLLYRHGYPAEPRPTESQDYRLTVTMARLREAAFRLVHPYISSEPKGRTWGMRLKPANEPSKNGSLRVAATFDPTWVSFTAQGADQAADLDLMLIADDPQRNIVGETTEQLHLRLTPAEYARTKKQWLTVEYDVPLTGRPAYVRGILYQFETDRTASAQARIAK